MHLGKLWRAAFPPSFILSSFFGLFGGLCVNHPYCRSRWDNCNVSHSFPSTHKARVWGWGVGNGGWLTYQIDTEKLREKDEGIQRETMRPNTRADSHPPFMYQNPSNILCTHRFLSLSLSPVLLLSLLLP
ncbi:hypothetical protein BGZ63DRAFT_122037 [Mariannaea sp. PMI_226]|nr:hypothetical protein BGZ63DRAFT_122037 [Mariannaea sp. PMI_226]